MFFKKHKGKFNTFKRKENIFFSLMVAFPILNFIMLWLIPNIGSIFYAFRIPIVSSEGYVFKFSFFQFQRIFQEIAIKDSILLQVFVNSLLYFAISMLIVTPLTLIFAYFIYKRVYGYSIYRVVFFLPSIISIVVLSNVYMYALSPDGLLNQLLSKISGFQADMLPNWIRGEKAYQFISVVGYNIWMGFGMGMILYSSAFARVPMSVIEYGRIEGVGMCTELFRIMLPMIWGTFVTQIVFGLAGLLSFMGPLLIFYPISGTVPKSATLSYYLLFFIQDGTGRYEYPSAVGLIMGMICTPFILAVRHLLNRFGPEVEY